MTSRGRGRRAGFTFVEVLAAMLFLAIVVPAIVTALTLSNRASEMTDRGTTAGQLAENKLNEMLIGNAWQGASNTSGDCGADFPGYRWELTQEQWTGDSAATMTQLKMEVFFQTQGTEHGVALTTLVSNPATTATSTGTGTSGGTGLP